MTAPSERLTIVGALGTIGGDRLTLLRAIAAEIAPFLAAELQGLAVAAAARDGETVSLTKARKIARVTPATIATAVRLSEGEAGYLPSQVVGTTHGSAKGARRVVAVDALLGWVRSGGPSAVRARGAA